METPEYIVCSECFSNQGIKLMSVGLGNKVDSECFHCGSSSGSQLTKDMLYNLAHRFFVQGSYHKVAFGGASTIQFNDYHSDKSMEFEGDINKDAKLITSKLNVGFFPYGPRLWMVGEIEPLKSLQSENNRSEVIERILSEYPEYILDPGVNFYRLRKNPLQPCNVDEYDSPNPEIKVSNGRLDSTIVNCLYASQDLDLCLHECRVTVEDELFLATMSTLKPLRLLDLTAYVSESVTEFESLGLAIGMLFRAGNHSYQISQELAKRVLEAGYDGVNYPSYYSHHRGTVLRKQYEEQKLIPKPDFIKPFPQDSFVPNLAIFGRPIADKLVEVKSINRVILNGVDYHYGFGPSS